MYFNIFLENMHVYVYIYSPYILKYPKNIVVVISGITFNFSIFPLCLLVFSKLYSRIYRSFYFVWVRVLWRIGSHGYGEVPQSAVCKPENQEIHRYNSVCVQRPESQGAKGVSPGLNLRTRGANSQGQEKREVPVQVEGTFTLPPPFWSSQALSWLDHAHLTSEGDLLYLAYWFKCQSLVKNTLIDTPGSNVLPAICVFLTLSSWHIKLTVPDLQLKQFFTAHQECARQHRKA